MACVAFLFEWPLGFANLCAKMAGLIQDIQQLVH